MSEKKKVSPIIEYSRLCFFALLVLVVPVLIAYQEVCDEVKQDKAAVRAKIIRIEATVSRGNVAFYIFNVDGTIYEGSERINVSYNLQVGDSVALEYSSTDPGRNCLAFY